MDDELKYMLMKVLYKLDELLKEIHENKDRTIPLHESKNRSIPYAERGDERYRYSPPMPWFNQTICKTNTTDSPLIDTGVRIQ